MLHINKKTKQMIVVPKEHTANPQPDKPIILVPKLSIPGKLHLQKWESNNNDVLQMLLEDFTELVFSLNDSQWMINISFEKLKKDLIQILYQRSDNVWRNYHFNSRFI
jgi:hypothetical protein